MQMVSLRSDLTGWQYYDIALELVEQAGVRKADRASRLCLQLDLSLQPGAVVNMPAWCAASWRRRIRSARSRGCR